MESELRLSCVCLRQLDIHPSSKKGGQNADEQTCVFNTFLPAQCLWVSEQHFPPAKAAPVCVKQLLLQTCRGSVEHPPRTAGLCTALQGDNGEATPQDHGGVPRLLAAHQTNYGRVSGVGGRVILVIQVSTVWTTEFQWGPVQAGLPRRRVTHKEEKRMK